MKKIFSLCLLLIMGVYSTIVGNFIFATGGNEGVASADLSDNSCFVGVGKDCFKYNDYVTGLKNKDRTVLTIIQDVILTAGLAVGTVLTIVCLYCGIMYIFAARGNASSVANLKKGLINSGIGAMLVRSAYTIIRLVQYVAQG